MINRNFVKKHITIFSVLIFLILYFAIYIIKPDIIFENDGSLRQFGIGYNKRTFLPAWLVAILLAIVSYFLILYYTSNSNLYFF